MQTAVSLHTTPAIRPVALKALCQVLLVWFLTTAAALLFLLHNMPDMSKVALCWQIFLLPGSIGHEIIRIRNLWRGDPFTEASNLIEHLPLVASAIAALLVAYFIF